MIEVHGKEVAMKDIDLTGKLKSITCAKVDAIGFLRPEGNQRILSFNTSDEIICGARPQHLKNKEIIMSEMDDKGNLTTYWDKIYID